MGRGNFNDHKPDDDGVQQKKTDKNLHGKCEAWGCNRWGHVYVGKWYCRYHHACYGEKIGEQLAHVSLILSNHGSEIDWYEFLLQSSFVDYLSGVVDCTPPGHETVRRQLSTAPSGLQPEKGEDFHAYRKRIETHINHLLKLDKLKLRPAISDGKRLAAGDNFNNFGDYAPDFS